MVDFDQLRKRMASETVEETRIELLVAAMAETFDLDQRDVAILTESNDILVFQHPGALRKSIVPITAKSVAGQTFQRNKVFVYNNFREVQHIDLFEQFVRGDQGVLPVQRIISCPIPGTTGPRGVLQVCRKGQRRDDTQPFTRLDTDNMIIIAKISGRLLFR